MASRSSTRPEGACRRPAGRRPCVDPIGLARGSPIRPVTRAAFVSEVRAPPCAFPIAVSGRLWPFRFVARFPWSCRLLWHGRIRRSVLGFFACLPTSRVASRTRFLFVSYCLSAICRRSREAPGQRGPPESLHMCRQPMLAGKLPGQQRPHGDVRCNFKLY